MTKSPEETMDAIVKKHVDYIKELHANIKILREALITVKLNLNLETVPVDFLRLRVKEALATVSPLSEL